LSTRFCSGVNHIYVQEKLETTKTDMRVAFFQRFFAHYQWGLVDELANHSEYKYSFFGDVRDPAHSGIAPIPYDRRCLVDFHVIPTWQTTLHLAIQPAAAWIGLFGKYDTFIFEGSFTHPFTWLAMWMVKSRKKRVLLYTHGWNRTDTNAIIRYLRLAFYRLADGLLLYGHKAWSVGLSLGIAPEKMYVVYNSLDYHQMVALRDSIRQAHLKNIRERLFGNAQLPVIIYVGRLIASKHVDQLVEACSRVISRGHPLGLVVVGAGPELVSLKNKASRLNVPAIFTGPVYDEKELSLLISAATVMVVPGDLGLSAIHAMTYGTPVITNNVFDKQGPEVETIIPGQTGAFFHQNDLDSLVEVLIPFINDPDVRSRYRQNCIAMVDQYYNPVTMRLIFDQAVNGVPSRDSLSFSLDQK
jgi:glycosyltransferase involved in cell wall biosynthesis